ncbi:hypothetical protein CGRA01v4_11423 [Colletotrichum graminicola]|nr:hypothetical protein CGRA01v4_11423 [Colletotrichum graminicola]
MLANEQRAEAPFQPPISSVFFGPFILSDRCLSDGMLSQLGTSATVGEHDEEGGEAAVFCCTLARRVCPSMS